jgi:hypothetical protein
MNLRVGARGQDVRNECAWAICNALCGSAPAQRQIIIDMGAMAACTAFLLVSSGNARVSLVVCHAFCAVCGVWHAMCGVRCVLWVEGELGHPLPTHVLYALTHRACGSVHLYVLRVNV